MFAGTDATDDNSLLSFLPYRHLGSSDVLWVGGKNGEDPRKSIIRFNLSELAGKTVVSATLRLSMYRGGLFYQADFQNEPTEFYEILSANADWLEGAFSNNPTGLATWGSKSHNDVPWAGSPGLGDAGVDYAPVLAGAVHTSSDDPEGTFYTMDLNADVVQGWIDNPSSNGGLLMQSAPLDSIAEIMSFHSSEAADPEQRPLLTVVVVPEPGVAALVALGMIGFRRRRR